MKGGGGARAVAAPGSLQSERGAPFTWQTGMTRH